MGEAESGGLKLDFNGHLGLEFRGTKVVSHARKTAFKITEAVVPI